MNWLYILLAVLAGAMLPVQGGVNAELAKWVQSPLRSGFVSFAVGALTLLLTTLFLGPWPSLNAVTKAPPWVWVGGALGAFYVSTVILLAPKLGALLTFSLLIAGQMMASLLLDHLGLIGYLRHPISPGRVVGAVLLVMGVLLIRRF